MPDWFRRRQESELDEEIRFHLEREIEERMGRGLTREEAERAARRDFGNEGQVRETTRAAWGWTSVERVLQDLRYGARGLRRSPVFAATAALSLAIGIGANVASFSLADMLLLRPLPVASPDKVVAIVSQSQDNPYGNVSYPVFRDIRDGARPFSGVVGHQLGRFAFAPSPEAPPQMRFGLKVTDGFFRVLGIEPALGRAFSEAEANVPGGEAVVVLGHDFWRQQFSADPKAIGSAIRINGAPFTVIGVAPERFTGMDPLIRPAFFLPASAAAVFHAAGLRSLEDRRERALAIRARLRPGVTLEQAQAEMFSLSNALAGQYPEVEGGRQLSVRTETDLRLRSSPPTTAMMAMLLALSAAVLLIACANVAGLLMARSRARSREMAIRLSIGAGRGRLVQQLFTETLLLAAAGGAAGTALAGAALHFLSSLRPPTDTPIVLAPELDGRVLLFAAAVSAASALLFGLMPALRAVRPDVLPALKRGELRAEGRRRDLGRGVLVGGQVALSVVLLIVAAGLLDGFRKMLVLDPGIRTDRLLMMEFEPPMTGYGPAQTAAFFGQIVDRVRTLSGVRSAALTRAIPFRPNFTEQPVAPEGYEFPRDQTSIIVSTNPVDEAYFETVGTPIVRGRAFNAADTASSRPVAIVNEEFAKRYWPGQEPLGKRLRYGAAGTMIEVVGVAKTGKYLTLTEPPTPYLYLPLAQHPQNRVVLMVRTEAAPAGMIGPVLAVVHALDPNQPVFNIRVFSEYYEQGVLGISLVALEMVGAIGFSGLALALVGLYGLVAYSVSRRSREIGIRMAVGAGRSTVLRLVLRQGIVLTAWGLAAGLCLSVPVHRALGAALTGVGGAAAWTMVAAPSVLLLAALCACAVPAWRATRIDPAAALREDG